MRSSERQTLDYAALGTPGHAQPQRQLPPLRAHPFPHPREIRTRDLLGIPLAMTDYEQTMDVMDGRVARGDRGWVCAVAVHAVMVAQSDPEMRRALVDSAMTVPDGMPLVWAVNMLGEQLENRVYGPELMSRYSDRCAESGHRIWLYGGRDQGSLVQLALSLRRKHPGIQIVGGV